MIVNLTWKKNWLNSAVTKVMIVHILVAKIHEPAYLFRNSPRRRHDFWVFQP